MMHPQNVQKEADRVVREQSLSPQVRRSAVVSAELFEALLETRGSCNDRARSNRLICSGFDSALFPCFWFLFSWFYPADVFHTYKLCPTFLKRQSVVLCVIFWQEPAGRNLLFSPLSEDWEKSCYSINAFSTTHIRSVLNLIFITIDFFPFLQIIKNPLGYHEGANQACGGSPTRRILIVLKL